MFGTGKNSESSAALTPFSEQDARGQFRVQVRPWLRLSGPGRENNFFSTITLAMSENDVIKLQILFIFLYFIRVEVKKALAYAGKESGPERIALRLHELHCSNM